MGMRYLTPLTIGLMAAGALSARANLILFEATLTGSQEVPPHAVSATGFGTVLLDDVADTITVNESWSGLTGPATASHIHTPAPPGATAPVVFPFAGVPPATSGSIPQQTFSITPVQIAQLEAGLDYMNVHTAQFPGGEIRGQLVKAPDSGPGVLAFVAIGVVGLLGHRRQRLEAAAN